MSDHDDPAGDDLVFPPDPPGTYRPPYSFEPWDVLVTLSLTELAKSKERDEQGAREAHDQLNTLITEEPDPTHLIRMLVLHVALDVIGKASTAKVEPLVYWQQQRLDQTRRLAESDDWLKDLRWSDIPDDIWEKEKHHFQQSEDDGEV